MSLTAAEKSALTHWGIHRVDSAQRASGGTSHRIFLLETESGPVVLRAYSPIPFGRLQWEHRVIAYAAGRGVPTPRPLPTAAGDSHLELDGRYYALFPRITGRQIARADITVQAAYGMGIFLAELESRLADFPISEAPHQKLLAFECEAHSQTLATIEELSGVIRAWPEPGEDEALALSHLEGQRAWLQEQGQDSGLDTTYRPILAHNDFQESNLFFSGDEVCAIIDWERCRVVPWGWEIVRAMHLALHLNPSLCRAFLAGYGTNVNEEELAHTARIYGRDRELNTWVFRAIYQEGNERVRRFLKPGGFRSFEDQWEELRRSIGEPSTRD